MILIFGCSKPKGYCDYLHQDEKYHSSLLVSSNSRLDCCCNFFFIAVNSYLGSHSGLAVKHTISCCHKSIDNQLVI